MLVDCGLVMVEVDEEDVSESKCVRSENHILFKDALVDNKCSQRTQEDKLLTKDIYHRIKRLTLCEQIIQRS